MDSLVELKNQAQEYLIERLQEFSPKHDFSEVLEYATLPPGKLFRSLIVYNFAKDKNGLSDDQALWASAIELHHTYTLIHDDLPAMDDDDMRRGKLATHKKFNEWSAILAGDALLSMSYGVLAKLSTDKLSELLKLFHSYTGSEGLILGQVLDLGGEDKSLEKLLRVHHLKTAKLIQLSLHGVNELSSSPISFDTCEKIGMDIGINFQLLDDLCELSDDLGEHELEINPFLHFNSKRLLAIIEENSSSLRQQLTEHKLHNLRMYLNTYMEKIQEHLQHNFEDVNKHIELTRDQIERIKI